MKLINSLKKKKEEYLIETKDKSFYNCCFFFCDDPDLTSLPITYFFQAEKTYTTKICRNCMLKFFEGATMSFYNDNVINMKSLEQIIIKPPPIPSIQCKEYKKGAVMRPQLPLGLMISVLLNNKNDDELASYVSTYLYSISEFTIRVNMRRYFTFCPEHRSTFYKIDKSSKDEIRCTKDGCQNAYCRYCLQWHDNDYPCLPKKEGYVVPDSNAKQCPNCDKEVIKEDDSCNLVVCTFCYCSFCFLCRVIFKSDSEGYQHLDDVHGGFWNNKNDDIFLG